MRRSKRGKEERGKEERKKWVKNSNKRHECPNTTGLSFTIGIRLK